MDFVQAIKAIRECSLIAVRNDNGADQLQCPFCWASIRVIGYADFGEAWTPYSFNDRYHREPMKHTADCALLQAWHTPIPGDEDNVSLQTILASNNTDTPVSHGQTVSIG